MGVDYHDRAAETRQILNTVSQNRTAANAVAEHFSIDAENEYSGRKTTVTVLTRRVEETTETAPLSDDPSIESPDEIDRGGSDIDLDSVFEKHPTISEDGTEVISYRGITDTEQIECPDCDRSGNTCFNCSGSGTEQCSNCSNGTVEHRCGCYGLEKHRGYTLLVRAKTGEILKTCTRCGGDGSRTMGSETVECDTCNGAGELVETCPNCGGDGVSRREDCTRCDGRGSHTCDRCDGSGDVDTCKTCDGRGEAVTQYVYTVTYELAQRTQMDADETVAEYADEIAWEQTGTETVTDGFADLPVSVDAVTDGGTDADSDMGSGSVDTLAANVQYQQPILYDVCVTLEHPTAGDEGASSKSVSTLVSESVLERDGTFTLRDERGFVGRYVFGSAYALGNALWMGASVGFAGAVVIGVLMAILVDFAGVTNPASLVSHPFSNDINGLFFIVWGVVGGLAFVFLFWISLNEQTSKYNFGYESGDEKTW